MVIRDNKAHLALPDQMELKERAVMQANLVHPDEMVPQDLMAIREDEETMAHQVLMEPQELKVKSVNKDPKV